MSAEHNLAIAHERLDKAYEEIERLRAELGRLIWVNDEVKRLRAELAAYAVRIMEERAQAVATERERCARLVVTWPRYPVVFHDLAAAIRKGEP